MPKSVPTPAGEEHYVAFIRGRFVLTSWEMQNLPQCFLLQRDQAAHTSVFALLPGHKGYSDSQHPTIVRCVKRSSEQFCLSFSFSTLHLFVTMAPTHIAWVYGCLQATWIVRTQADPWVSFTCLSCMASGGSSLIILRSSLMGLER